MSQILQATVRSTGGAILVTDSTSPPVRYSGGLPRESDGSLSIDLASAISAYNHGLPFTAAGRIACSTGGVVRFGSGAAPFDAAGRLVMGDTGASTFSIAGVIYTSALEIFADGLTPPPAPVWSGTPAPPDGTVGAGYLYDYSPFLNTNRVNLTLETGTMPAGMSFVGSYLTGTPTEDGDFTGWTVRATNVTGTAVSASHSLTVNPASNWILADGTWNDSGEWVDTATWNDGV